MTTNESKVLAALQEIAEQDDIEMVLDPTWAKRIAQAALLSVQLSLAPAVEVVSVAELTLVVMKKTRHSETYCRSVAEAIHAFLTAEHPQAPAVEVTEEELARAIEQAAKEYCSSQPVTHNGVYLFVGQKIKALLASKGAR